MLSSSFDNDFWSRTTLQMAFSEPAVRHALIALGYSCSIENGTMKHARSKYTSAHGSKTLLLHYNKSVRSLVDRIGQSNYTPEIGLVTCLLFVCMEFLRGNYHTAFTHLTNGLKIISEHRKQKGRDATILRPSSSSDHVCTPISAKTSSLLEDELEPIFVRSLASAMMYGVDVEATVQIPAPDLAYYQDLRFSNLREVQMSAYQLRNQSILRIRDFARQIVWDQRKVATAEELHQRDIVLACQRAWLAAMEQYRATHTLSEADELAISALLMHYYITYNWLATVEEIRESAFDAHLDDFKTVLYHARRILDAMDLDTTKPVAWFTFEISICPALYFVARSGRCPVTRREAVSLLERNPPREGLWDAAQHAIVSKRVIELEEAEVDPATGWPVERARFWNTVIDANMDEKGGFWVSFMPVTEVQKPASEGKPEFVLEFFTM
jgi:hypothetical protein